MMSAFVKMVDRHGNLKGHGDTFFGTETTLTLKAPNRNFSRQHLNFFLLSFEENKA